MKQFDITRNGKVEKWKLLEESVFSNCNIYELRKYVLIPETLNFQMKFDDFESVWFKCSLRKRLNRQYIESFSPEIKALAKICSVMGDVISLPSKSIGILYNQNNEPVPYWLGINDPERHLNIGCVTKTGDLEFVKSYNENIYVCPVMTLYKLYGDKSVAASTEKG